MRPGQRVTEETRAKMRAAQADPAVRERQRAAAAAYWTPERPEEARQRATLAASDPVWLAKVRVGTAKGMAKPLIKTLQVEGIRAAMARPEVREKISRRTREAMADPAVRQRIVDGMERARAHPERVERIAAGIRQSFERDHIVVETAALATAWADARPAARQQFLESIGVPPTFAWSTARNEGVRP